MFVFRYFCMEAHAMSQRNELGTVMQLTFRFDMCYMRAYGV